MAPRNDLDVMTPDLAAVVNGTHNDPHEVLGFHRGDRGDEGGGIRAYRPSAVAVRVLIQGQPPTALGVVGDGLFAGFVPEEAAAGYLLQAEYPGGLVVTFDDPYRFVPTLGELDLYLIGEGRHLRLWEVLGAQRRSHQGVEGTS